MIAVGQKSVSMGARGDNYGFGRVVVVGAPDGHHSIFLSLQTQYPVASQEAAALDEHGRETRYKRRGVNNMR
ncbi:hypothetical protein XI06_13450 [Bradyrhizobium sp. CCBAU 11434]|nr:hypothetical protein [Bradyrhizobium sp. CCBAU 11434]